MTSPCLGVRTDDKGNSATIIREPLQPLEETCRRINERIYALLAEEGEGEGGIKRDVRAQVRKSLAVLGEALGRYRLDELSLSYNGGKDCLVLLILYLCALHTHFHKPRTTDPSIQPSHQQPFPEQLNTVYIPTPSPFPAMESFIHSSARTYHLSLSEHPHPMRSAFTSYLASHPEIRAIFVGTRRTDPHGADLTPFDPTDRGWPEFMRVHPVVEWHYAEVWEFLRSVEVPYCGLYDEGYTSLGSMEDTWRNPHLKREDGSFRPAFELVGDEEERLGRESGSTS